MISPALLAAEARALPPLSPATFKVVALLRTGAASLREVEDALMTDPALAANVLRLANSPFLGLRREVRSLTQAINLIGLARLGDLAATMSLQATLPTRLPGYGISQQDFLRHSVAVAVLAERLGNTIYPNTGASFFVAGLLHDVGKLLLARHLSDRQSEIDLNLARNLTLLETESSILGTCHTEVAAHACRAWHLPGDVADAAVGHHQPNAHTQSAHTNVIDIVHVADITSHALGYGRDIAGLARSIASDCFQRLKIRPSHLERLVSDCLESLASTCRAVTAEEARS